MVMCNMDGLNIVPRPPVPPGDNSSKNSSGFRLQDDRDDAGSVYSVYKQKIDAMFESDSSTNTKNSVQAKIEKMFTDVAKDEGVPAADVGSHVFSVDYLGSVPLMEKVTSLAGLQSPLRELYFAYKKNSKHKQPLSGRLEISSIGLKVQYQGDKGDLEQLNSFPTIAVWSAVKFVLHEEPTNTYAFLPLITDPDNIDKQTLFRELDPSEKKLVSQDFHSPLFAVVMRKFGVQKQLECHGFVCQTSEDAIVIAATLYKSLMAHMKAKEMRVRNRNGVTCMSTASSVLNDGSVPVRPPRKKKSSTSSTTSDRDISDTHPLIQDKPSRKSKKTPKDDLDAIVPYDDPCDATTDDNKDTKSIQLTDKWNTFMSNKQKQITAEIKQVLENNPGGDLKRIQSIRRRNSEGVKTDSSGDILTKVTIPRSGSFLNAGGLTRYKSNKVNRGNGTATGGSPLGFHELFNEFRLQEGLHSIDEILGVIIDPNGMSFNDLKPIYKEFLLKLALTLTKDELYQRSKAIMRRQKKKLLKKSSKKRRVVSSKFKKLGKMLKRRLEKKHLKKAKAASLNQRVEPKLPESSISTSSYDTRQFHPKQEISRKPSYRKRNFDSNVKRARERTSTSEESDFFSLKRKNKKSVSNNVQNRNSSSGYVSWSECSYDSDTCTCTSADKCYCSLGNKSRSPKKKSDKCSCGMDSPVFCGCDTDSCAESNKCYCQLGNRINAMKQGFIPSPPPPHRKISKKISNTRSTTSVEYVPNPAEAYYKQKALAMQERNRRRSYSNLPLNFGAYILDEMELKGRRRAMSEVHQVPPLVKRGNPSMTPDALSVKKSAEIAALFANIKLNQTTDVRRLSICSTRSGYSKVVPVRSYARSAKPSDDRMVHNSLYGGKTKKNGMYSATNGLYTIQSQSDDSRRSSISDKQKDDYFMDSQKNVSSSLENSLGYLP